MAAANADAAGDEVPGGQRARRPHDQHPEDREGGGLVRCTVNHGHLTRRNSAGICHWSLGGVLIQYFSHSSPTIAGAICVF